MAKVLVTCHLGRHFSKFGQYDMEVLLKMGHEVHIAANFRGELDSYENKDVIKHQIDFERNPHSLKHGVAYNQLKKLFKEKSFDLIHTQSPAGGVITRLAARDTKKNGTKVMYTPHGFHIFEGAPKMNWLVYGTIEKLLSKLTDCIITINDEDYHTASDYLKHHNVKQIPGVGIDLKKYSPQSKKRKYNLRKKHNISNKKFVMIYAAELSERKNQTMLLEVMKKINKTSNDFLLLLPGSGLDYTFLQNKIQTEMIANVSLLGQRNDIDELLQLSDIAVSSSTQEGLPVNIMEAMAVGLPIIATDCRGNRDLVTSSENGFVVDINDVKSFSDAINKIKDSDKLKKSFSENGLTKIKQYSTENVQKEMSTIYSSFIN